ncbi:MAG: flagellar motor switch protein FliN [Thermodesulfobacteria bacterium]|nr:flagellar motor switch protein FliN [Thermodesulfobacteriota bacterium]
MLTQEELDKLLQEEAEGGGEGSEDSQEQEAQAAGDSGGEGEASGTVSQDELDKLLEGAGGEDGASEGDGAPEAASDSGGDDIDWSDAFKEAAEGGDAAAQKAVSEGLPEDAQAAPEPPPQKECAPAAQFNELSGGGDAKPGTKPELNFLLEIPLEVQVELGRCTLQIKELLQLGQGSIVELNKMAGEPADIYVNRKLMAKGEVVVVNEKFGIKLTEIISPQERVKSLG